MTLKATSSTASAACEHCGKLQRVMLAMVPGKDGKDWSLCPKCWIDGTRSMHDVRAIVEPEPPGIVIVPVPAAPPAKARAKRARE